VFVSCARLFIDDEQALAEIAAAMLEKLGYRVTAVTDSREAWRLFLEDSRAFDLVITDQTMPDLTGVTLAQKMMRIRPDAPVILCTGYSEMVSPEKARKAGVREFLMKPLVRSELAAAIRHALDGGPRAIDVSNVSPSLGNCQILQNGRTHSL
jgi:CheY-like chemotaxis protein